VRNGWNILPLATISDTVTSECIRKHQSDFCPTILQYYSIRASHKEMCSRIRNRYLLTHHVHIYVNGYCLIEAKKLKIQFNIHGSVHRKNILIYSYIQQDVTFHSLFYLETALHVSGGTSTHHKEHKQLYLQHLVFVTPLLLSVARAAGSSNGVKNTRCCR
jgi:hypothetical protein